MTRRYLPVLGPLALLAGLLSAAPAPGILFYSFLPWNGAGKAPPRAARHVNPADVALPPGYCIEPVAVGLTYPTGVVTDEHDRVYVTESGYSYGEDFQLPRLLRVEPTGQVTEIARGENNGPWTGLSYHQGAFYVSEGGELKGGRILKITPDGQTAVLLDGIPSMGDHHTNRPVVGPDGSVYFGVGTFTNSGVVGADNAKFGWLKRFPQSHDVPPVDVVLAGRNFASLTEGGQCVLTGTFVPYGTPTQPGQVIPGRLPGSGAIHRLPPGGGPVELVAWGFRNPFGLTFGPDGCLYCTDNLYDERGSRPVYGAGDLLWRVQPGLWHGWPDYWGNIPLTHPRFGENKKKSPQPTFLLAQHPNVPPEPAAWLGVRSSSDGLDFSRNPAFGHCGEAFVAVFGDITPPAGQRQGPPAGRLPGRPGGRQHRRHQRLRGQQGEGGRPGLEGGGLRDRAAGGRTVQLRRVAPVRGGLRGNDGRLRRRPPATGDRGDLAGAADRGLLWRRLPVGPRRGGAGRVLPPRRAGRPAGAGRAGVAGPRAGGVHAALLLLPPRGRGRAGAGTVATRPRADRADADPGGHRGDAGVLAR